MNLVELIKSAGISVLEFADLVGVTRAVVYRWSHGGEPHELRKDKVNKLIAAIEHAVATGALPLSEDVVDRNRAIKTAVVTALRQLK